MGQKVHPIGFRLGGVYTWSSRWFAKHGSYRAALKQDILIRNFLQKRLKEANVSKVDIERSAGAITVQIYTAKPGVIIGRGGQGVEALRRELKQLFLDSKTTLTLNIQEIDKPNLSAMLVVQAIVADIEKRIPFRRAIRQALARLIKAGAEGAKILVAGRLDGTEIARAEKLVHGKIPLHTIRANIDYARGAAHTTYGVVGVKVWIYKGEIFQNGGALKAAEGAKASAKPRRLRAVVS
jgi:small subunit ribosomal protein S3